MTSLAELGTLEDVAVTAAWPREASDFTPWLCDNLERLSAAVGLPLEYLEREVQVGRYKADILARNMDDGENVLIENQLYASDHTHVGQILTYLAGVQAKTIIWIAPHFREEHLSAIRWLNEHTVDPFAFFAVKLRVVKIGGSPLAPLLEILEKPNSWDRTLSKTVKNVAQQADGSGWRRTFWDRYVELYPEAEQDRGGGGHGSSRWRIVPDSHLIVARWVGDDCVSVFIRGERGVRTTEIYEELSDAKEIEEKLGVSIGDNEWYPFDQVYDVDVTDPEQRDAAIHWLEQKTREYVRVVGEYASENS